MHSDAARQPIKWECTMNDPINPYAAPRSDSELARDPHTSAVPVRRWRWVTAATLSVLLMIGAAAAGVFALGDIETIIASGMILSLGSLALLVVASKPPLKPLRPIGLYLIACSIAILVTIVVRDWSPSDAQKPIGRATAVCGVICQLGWISLVAVSRAVRTPDGDPPSSVS